MPSVQRVTELVETTRPLVNRLADDDELRENLRSALGSAQRVYSGLGSEPSRKGAALRLLADPELQRELQGAVAELRLAGDRARQTQSRSRSKKKYFFFGVIAAALLLNPTTGPPLRERLSSLVSRDSGVDLDFEA